MPSISRQPSTASILSDMAATKGGEIVFDTAFVARNLDRLIAGRLQDLNTLRQMALETKAGAGNESLYRQLVALARSAREAYDGLQQSREILIGLHKQASGGDVIAAVDTPTDLPNKTSFDARLSEALRQLADGHTLSLMLIEVGALQLLANEAGSAVANRIVKRFSTILRRTVKRTDYVARVGPQHFTVIFEDILPEKAVPIALRIHDAIKSKMTSDDSSVAGVLSISMGIATATGPGTTADDLLQKAQDAVTEARKEGRPSIYVT